MEMQQAWQRFQRAIVCLVWPRARDAAALQRWNVFVPLREHVPLQNRQLWEQKVDGEKAHGASGVYVCVRVGGGAFLNSNSFILALKTLVLFFSRGSTCNVAMHLGANRNQCVQLLVNQAWYGD